MKKIFLMLVLTALAVTAGAQSQLTTVRGKTKDGKTIKVEYYKGSVEDYVESVKYDLVDELQAKANDLQTKLDAANKQIKELKADKSDVNDLREEIKQLKATIKTLNHQLNEIKISRDSLAIVNSGLQEQIDFSGGGDSDVRRLRDSIVSKDATIRRLNNSLSDSKKRVNRLEKDLELCSSSPTGYPKPTPVIGLNLGIGPAFAKGVGDGWSRDINWVKKAEVYFGTARLTSAYPISAEAGVGIRSFSLSATRSPYELTVPGTDADGDSFQAMYAYGTLQECLSLTYIDIPLRFCIGQPAKNLVGVYAKIGVTPSIKISDKFQGSGTYSLKGYYPQWDVTLENITELGFGSDLEYYTVDNTPEAKAFVLWGNATLGGYVPLKGQPILFNAGLGLDVPLMDLTKSNAGSKAVMATFEIGMVYTLK